MKQYFHMTEFIILITKGNQRVEESKYGPFHWGRELEDKTGTGLRSYGWQQKNKKWPVMIFIIVQRPWCTAVFLLKTTGEVLTVSELMQCCSGPSVKVSPRKVSRLTGLEQATSDIQAVSMQISYAAHLGSFSTFMLSFQGSRVGSNPAVLCWQFPSLQRERWLTGVSTSHFFHTSHNTELTDIFLKEARRPWSPPSRSGCKAIILYTGYFS